jgi:hypothetical protein
MYTNISTKELIDMLTYPGEYGLTVIDEEAISEELDEREVEFEKYDY